MSMSYRVCDVCGNVHASTNCPPRQISRAIISMFPDVQCNTEALSAARAEGYKAGLSELARKFEPDEIIHGIEVQIVADQLKRAYEKGGDGNGKAE